MAEEHINIFITLTSRPAFRNLFLFPGSVFEILKDRVRQDPRIRIVVVTTAREREKYAATLGEERGLFVVEGVSVRSPRATLLRRLFYFFASYLIYTDTTRLLATMGTRPEDPPAGGNRALAPVKWLVSRTFGKVKFVKRVLTPWLYEKIFNDRPFRKLYEKYRPVSVFSGHIYSWFDQECVAEARRQGVRSVAMAANWDHLDKYFLPIRADRFLAQSDERKDAAVRYQEYDARQMILTGYPHFDFMTDPRFVGSREEVLKKLGFPGEGKFILYVSGSTYCPDEPDIIETILKWIEAGEFGRDVYLLIRPYPGGRGSDRDFDEAKYNRFENHPLVRFYRTDFWQDFTEGIYFINILRQADIVLSIFSTMSLEAAVLDRPLAAVSFDGYRERPFHRSIRRLALFEHFQNVRKTGALPTAENFDELKRILKENLENPKLFGEERRVLRDRLCYKLDGKASERVAGAILGKGEYVAPTKVLGQCTKKTRI